MSKEPKEIWKPVPEYEDLYEVSNMGRVRSLFRYKKILHPSLTNGYFTVELWKDKQRKRIGVHRLVAMCFCENPKGKPFVNHKDESRTNNNASNLEWVTHIENCNYGTAIIRRVKHTDFASRRVNNANQIIKVSKPVDQFDRNGNFIKRWESASECSRETGFSVSGIRGVATGKRNSIFGYVFREVCYVR